MSKTKSGIVKETPSEKVTYDWHAIARDLERAPNEWHKVFENDRHSLVVSLRSGSNHALLPQHGFETTTRNTRQNNPDAGQPRTCTLYLRYVPEKDERRTARKKD